VETVLRHAQKKFALLDQNFTMAQNNRVGVIPLRAKRLLHVAMALCSLVPIAAGGAGVLIGRALVAGEHGLVRRGRI
jgi:hypothetical protein